MKIPNTQPHRLQQMYFPTQGPETHPSCYQEEYKVHISPEKEYKMKPKSMEVMMVTSTLYMPSNTTLKLLEVKSHKINT